MSVVTESLNATEIVLAERVRRGAEHEDAINPGWAARIDRIRLDMDSCLDCIIGQLHGHYMAEIDNLAPEVDSFMEVNRWAQQHGFCSDASLLHGHDTQCEILRRAWLAEIAKRLDADA